LRFMHFFCLFTTSSQYLLGLLPMTVIARVYLPLVIVHTRKLFQHFSFPSYINNQHCAAPQDQPFVVAAPPCRAVGLALGRALRSRPPCQPPPFDFDEFCIVVLSGGVEPAAPPFSATITEPQQRPHRFSTRKQWQQEPL